MSKKNITPAMGYTIQEGLREIKDFLTEAGYEGNQLEALEYVCSTLANQCNQEACLSGNQLRALKRSVESLVTEIFETGGKLNNIGGRFDTLTAYMNSFRLDCRNCLNFECSNRDTEDAKAGVSELEKRSNNMQDTLRIRDFLEEMAPLTKTKR